MKNCSPLLRNKCLVAFVSLLLATTFLSAQQIRDSLQAPSPALVASTEPEVVGVRSSNDEMASQAGLEDVITVKISNAAAFLEQARSQNQPIILYLNNLPLKDLSGIPTADGAEFFISHEGSSVEVWDALIAMRRKGEIFSTSVSVSVGIGENPPLKTSITRNGNKSFRILLLRKKWFVGCMFIILLILIFSVLLSRKTDMLRESGLPPATGRRPFTLAKVQMAIWFVVIISSWLLLYVSLHRFDLMNESILILVGITAGTGVGGMALDSNRKLQQSQPSKGFFRDVISSGDSVSFSQFQNLAWTLVLVIVFIRNVLCYFKMPEFDNTLLLFMGISSGTYITGKVTEDKNKAAEEESPAATTEG